MNLTACFVPLIFFNLKKTNQMKQLFESFPYDRHNNSLSKKHQHILSDIHLIYM